MSGGFMNNNNRKMTHRPTVFEVTRILGARAKQISQGSPSTVDYRIIHTYNNPLDIAKAEMRMKRFPLLVERKMPNGKKFEINPNDHFIEDYSI